MPKDESNRKRKRRMERDKMNQEVTEDKSPPPIKRGKVNNILLPSRALLLAVGVEDKLPTRNVSAGKECDVQIKKENTEDILTEPEDNAEVEPHKTNYQPNPTVINNCDSFNKNQMQLISGPSINTPAELLDTTGAMNRVEPHLNNFSRNILIKKEPFEPIEGPAISSPTDPLNPTVIFKDTSEVKRDPQDFIPVSLNPVDFLCTAYRSSESYPLSKSEEICIYIYLNMDFDLIDITECLNNLNLKYSSDLVNSTMALHKSLDKRKQEAKEILPNFVSSPKASVLSSKEKTIQSPCEIPTNKPPQRVSRVQPSTMVKQLVEAHSDKSNEITNNVSPTKSRMESSAVELKKNIEPLQVKESLKVSPAVSSRKITISKSSVGPSTPEIKKKAEAYQQKKSPQITNKVSLPSTVISSAPHLAGISSVGHSTTESKKWVDTYQPEEGPPPLIKGSLPTAVNSPVQQIGKSNVGPPTAVLKRNREPEKLLSNKKRKLEQSEIYLLPVKTSSSSSKNDHSKTIRKTGNNFIVNTAKSTHAAILTAYAKNTAAKNSIGTLMRDPRLNKNLPPSQLDTALLSNAPRPPVSVPKPLAESQKSQTSNIPKAPVVSQGSLSRNSAGHDTADYRYYLAKDIPFKIIHWRTEWLDASADFLPQILSKIKFNEVKNSYASEVEYSSTYFALHLLCIWCNIKTAWEGSPTPYECLFDDFEEKKYYFRNTWKQFLSAKDIPIKQSIILVTYKNEKGCKNCVFGYIFEVEVKYNRFPQASHATLKDVKFSFYTKEKIRVLKTNTISVQNLCSVRVAIKQYESLVFGESCRLRKVVCIPEQFPQEIENIDLSEFTCSFGVGIRPVMNKIYESVASSERSFYLVDRKSENSWFFLLALIRRFLNHYPIFICLKGIEKLCKIANAFKDINEYTVLGVKETEVDIPVDLRGMTLRAKAIRIDASLNEAQMKVINKSRVMLTVLPHMFLGKTKKLPKNTVCIIDDSHLASEAETALAMGLLPHKVLLLGVSSLCSSRKVSACLKPLGYQKTLYHRLLGYA